MAGTLGVYLAQIISRLILKDILDDRLTKATVIIFAGLSSLVAVNIATGFPEQYPRFGFATLFIVIGLAAAEGVIFGLLILKLVRRYNG